MSNSSLANYTRISPNRTAPRNHVIDTITIHCYVGQASVESMAGWLCNPNAQASANYGIGADGRIGLFVEEKDRSWCTSSRENDNRAITIECASAVAHPYAINANVYNSLIKLVTDICKRNGIKKLVWSTNKSERMNHRNGCNMTVHRDYANKSCPGDYIYNRLGQIAKEVNAKLGVTTSEPIREVKWYRVRKSWTDEKSQIGAYEVLQNAKEHCPSGYSVFDNSGKVVWTNVDAVSSAAPTGAYGIPKSKEDYIDKVGTICQKLQKETKILASVVTAQCCLETGFGLAEDCRVLMNVNNLLGMKTDLINSTWKDYTVWKGKSITKRTPEYYGGKLTYINDSFRAYTDYENCIQDYEMFLLHVKNNKGLKYARIAGVTDPAEAINIIRIGTGTNSKPEGYCTDPYYETKILSLIKEYNLTKFDGTEQKEVKKSQSEKVVDAANEMNNQMLADIKAKKVWTYCNNKAQGTTFEDSRTKGYYRTNCNLGCAWVYKKAGILPIDIGNFYGKMGKLQCNDATKKKLLKVFDIVDFKGTKTAAQLVTSGDLKLGDIVFYTNMVHTNIYLGGTNFFDSGHAFCSGSGEGAKFKKWIGVNPFASHLVGQVLRLKENTQTYRVRVGIFSVLDNAIKKKTAVKNKTGFDCFYEKIKTEYYVYCGSFKSRSHANDRIALLTKVGIAAEIDIR